MIAPQPFWVFDLDGTLADNAHRAHHARAGDWEEFHATLHLDTPREAVAGLFRLLCGFHVPVAIVTGRPERHRPATTAWLHAYDLLPWRLVMRGDGDYSQDAVCKLALVEGLAAEAGFAEAAEAVVVALEDRERVVEAFRATGIETWHVQAGGY